MLRDGAYCLLVLSHFKTLLGYFYKWTIKQGVSTRDVCSQILLKDPENHPLAEGGRWFQLSTIITYMSGFRMKSA